jgi:taurine dioxygenase
MTTLDLRPLSAHIGAEVHGLDLAGDLDDTMIEAIRAAWIEYQVVFFPEQRLTPEMQTAFARRFGEITEGHPVEPHLTGHPNVHPIDSMYGHTNFWHTDVTFMSRPPSGSLLYAVELPDVGGDTMWASTRAAYETLAAPLREFCDNLTAYHYDAYYANEVANGNGKVWEGKKVEKLYPVEHPVVRVHPESGRRNLFVNPQFTAGLKDFPAPQSRDFLRVLYRHMEQPEFLVRYRWSPGTVAFWDNRATMHFGIHDYGDARRVMHRVTLRGDRPYGPRADG